MRPDNLNPKFRILIFVGIILVLISGLALWLSKQSFIEITTLNGNSSTLRYLFVNQNTGAETIFDSKDNKVKKLVSKGPYEVTVFGSDSSYLNTVQTNGFIKTTKITGSLERELEREFVGYNPAPCMVYIAGILRTHECSAGLETVNTHVPATIVQPTYVQNAAIDNTAAINGVVYTKFGPVIFTSPVYITEEIFTADYRVSLLNDDFSVGRSIDLDYLALGQDYKIAEYLSGFIIYSSDLLDVYYYASFDSNPVKLKLGVPDDSTQRGINLSVKDNKIVRSFSNSLGGEEQAESDAQDNVESQILVYDGTKNIKFTTPEFLLNANACGDNQLCILTGDLVMTIYLMSESRLIRQKVLTDVSEIHQLASNNFLINSRGVLALDKATGSGNYVYTFGTYTFCGLKQSFNGMTLCLIDPKQKKLALNLILDQSVDGSFDKQLNAVSKDPRIDNISIYKNILYITPVISDPLETITFSPKQVARGQKNILGVLKDSGLNTSKLTIINTTSND